MSQYDDMLGKPVAGNEYDALLSEQAKQTGVELRSTMLKAADAQPERTAQVIKLSGRTGLPTDVVARQFDTVNRKATEDANDYDRMIQQSPKLVAWLKEGENAGLAKDDLAKLGVLEWLVTAPQRAWRRGNAQVEFGNLSSESLFRSLSAKEHERLKTLRSIMNEGGELGAENWFGHALVKGTQQLPMLFGGLLAGAKTGVPAATGAAAAAGLIGQAGPQIAFPEEIITVPGAAALGYYAGSTVGSARFGFRQEAGHAFEEFLKLKDELGRPMDFDVARMASIAAGGINAGLEVFQLNTIMRTIPGADKLFGATTRSAISKALQAPSVRNALKELALGYGKTLTLETSTEVAQRAVTILSGELGKFASGQDIERKSAGAIARDLATEAIEAAQAFTFISAPGHVARAGMESIRIREAKKNELFFKALGEEIAESKTFTRLPEAMQQFIERVTKDGPIENIYIPVEAWTTYFQAQGVDPKQVAAEVTGSNDAFEQATATGSDLAIPTSRYATILAPTDHNKALAKELRLGPDEMNAREAEEIEQAIAEEERKAKLAREEQGQQDTAQVISDRIVEMLVATGMEKSTAQEYATVNKALFSTIAQRAQIAGLDPVALFERYGLQIGRSGVSREGDTQIDQGQLDFGDRRQEPRGSADRRQDLAGRVDHAIAALTDAKGRERQLAATVAQNPTPENTANWKAARDEVGVRELDVKKSRSELERGRVSVTGLYQSDVAFVPSQKQTRSKAFKKWFKKSKVVDEEGNPLVVYHGTTADFTSFDRERGNPESDFGAGFYFTSEVEDVANNYAGEGPDLTNKVENLAERIAQETDRDYKDPEVIAEAKAKLSVEHGGMTMPVFLSLQNPVVVGKGPQKETHLEYRYEYEPLSSFQKSDIKELRDRGMDDDEVRRELSERNRYDPEETGTLAEFIAALRKIASRYDDGEVDGVIEKIMERADYDSISASELQEIIKGDEKFGYYVDYDNDGKLVSHEIVRQAFQEIGFDGIIDYTVDKKFGTQKVIKVQYGAAIRGKAMAGMNPDTVHYIAFEPAQIKSAVGNRGTFDALSGNILYQDTIDGKTGKVDDSPPFYSQLHRQIERAKISAAPASEWKKLIGSLANKGVKKEEVFWSGIMDWLDVASVPAESVRIMSKDGNPISLELRAIGVEQDVAEKIEERLKKEIRSGNQETFSAEASAEVSNEFADDLPATIAPILANARIVRAPMIVQEDRKPDSRITKDQVLEYLKTNGVDVKWKTLGGPLPKPKADAKAISNFDPDIDLIEQLPLDWTVVGSEGGGYDVLDENGDSIHHGLTRRGVLQDAIDELGPTEDEINERAQQLLDEDIPEMARQSAQDSDRVNWTYKVRLKLKNYKVEEVEAGLFRSGNRYVVKELTWDIINEVDDDASANQRNSFPDDEDELNEMFPDGPEEDFATDKEFKSEEEAIAWAKAHKFSDGNKGYDGDPVWILVEPESDYEEEHDSFDDAKRAAQRARDQAYEDEVEYYSGDGAPTLDDFGDRYYNRAREELEDERDDSPRRRNVVSGGPKDSRLPVRHKNSWQSSGGRDYVEIPFYIPNIESYNASDSTHFQTDTKGRTIAWMRAKVHNDERGVPTFWIEELQSQRGQAGRDKRDEIVKNLAESKGISIDEAKKLVPPDAGFKGSENVNLRLAQDFDAEIGELRTQMFAMIRAVHPDAEIHGSRGVEDWIADQRIADRAATRQEVNEVEALVQREQSLMDRRDAARSEGGTLIPDAPFIKDTQAWTALVLKYAIRYAVDNGIKQIAWTTGQEQVDRYKNYLREQIDKIEWKKTDKGIEIDAKHRGTTKVEQAFKPGALRAAIGREMAERIINDPNASGTIEGEDITFTDPGMFFSYGDKEGKNPNSEPSIITVVANKIIRSIGGDQVKTIDIDVAEGGKTYSGAPGFTITDKMEESAKSGQSLFQAERGSIRFGTDRKFRIDLLAGADLSTFAHESGHFWLEVLGDVVDQIKALDPLTVTDQQQRMVDDYDRLLDWFKVTNRSEIGREQHEQFARAIEQYLGEGKAPSAELRSAFAKFRQWIIAVYRSLTKLNVDLNDDVRAVFDRLLATDEQIASAEQEAQIAPIFTTAAQAGMTEAEFANYQDTVRKAGERARDDLHKRVMDETQREREAWWKAESDRVKTEVEAEFGYQRDYVAMSVLQRGTMPNGEELPEGMQAVKLDRAGIVALRGDGFLKALPRPYVYTKDGGVHPNVAAELFGYASGDELLDALSRVQPYRRAVESEVSSRMRAAHGDMMLDGSIVDAARVAVQGEERSVVIAAEMKALLKRQREVSPHLRVERQQVRARAREGMEVITGSVNVEAVRNMAEGRIAQLRVRDIKPQTYLVAARRANAEAIKLVAADDFQSAASAKQRELLNVELYRASMNALDEVESTLKYVRTFGDAAKRARIAKAGEDYLDQIDGLIDRYEFARIPLKTLDRRKSLAAWIADKERQGQSVTIPEEVQDESRRINYKELSYDELIGVRDSVKHIEHLARFKNKLLKAQKQRELEEVVTEVEESIRSNATRVKGRQFESRLPESDAARLVDQWFASHRKLSSHARQFDGFEDGGSAWEYFVRPLNAAADTEAQMNQEATTRLHAIFTEAYKGREVSKLYDKANVPAIGMSLSKMGRIAVALNWGNADNRQRVMDGYGWNESQVQAILDTLDQRDWKMVQEIWDFIDRYWTQIEAKEKRVNGIAPEKVKAEPVMTKFGTMRGGYYPLKYDDRQSAQAHGNRVKEMAEQMMNGAFTRSTTRRGHTKERSQNVEQPVRLDFGVIFEHTAQVIHDLTHHEALLDVTRVLAAKQVSSAIIEVYGDVVYKQVQDAIEDIAAGDIPAVGAFEKALNWTRTGVTIAGLGWNVTTSLLQPFGIAQSMVRVGPKWVALGMSRWLRDSVSFENTAAWIREKSPMMQYRMNTQLREINEIKNRIGLNSGRIGGWVDEILSKTTLDTVTRQGVVDSYFWLIYKGQQVADIPTWVGAYEKALADKGNDEARAIALADQAVLDSQGGGQMKDLAGVQRGGPLLKLWTNFYSYFNVTWNLTIEATRKTNYRDAGSIGRLAVDLLLLYTVPATLAALMRHALTGPDDDDDKLVERVIRENMSYMFGVMLGLREIGSAIQGYAGYEGPAGTRVFSTISKLVRQADQGELDEAFWRALNDAAGILLHYPAGQVRRTVEGYMALQDGTTRNPIALLVGPPKE